VLEAISGVVYPPLCMICREPTELSASLCGECWPETSFIAGLVCDACGTPLPGENCGADIHCDSCLNDPPSWDRGRAAVVYSGVGRRAVLGLKHGDRLDMGRPLAEWMARSGAPLLKTADVIVPVPLHWRRLVKRRYNQSAELARHLSVISGTPLTPDLLVRDKATPSQDGLSRIERHENQRGVFSLHNRRSIAKNILLVDDVMTTGATLSACADTLRVAGAERIDALVLARVAREQ